MEQSGLGKRKEWDFMIDIIHILRQKIESIRLLFLEDEVFYIGGSDVLPPPLEPHDHSVVFPVAITVLFIS